MKQMITADRIQAIIDRATLAGLIIKRASDLGVNQMDEEFKNWLVANDHNPNWSEDMLSELRIEYEEEGQEQEADEISLFNFAHYMLDRSMHHECNCMECKSVVTAWEDWWFDIYTGKGS